MLGHWTVQCLAQPTLRQTGLTCAAAAATADGALRPPRTERRTYGKFRGFENPGVRLGETSVFLQNGSKISELPVIVRKVNDIFELYKRLGIQHTSTELQPREEDKERMVLVFPAEISGEEMEIIAGFNRCFNQASIFRLLETIPRREVTPLVAVHALRKLVDLENNFAFRNQMKAEDLADIKSNNPDTFLRIAFMSMLLEIVCNSRQPSVILDGLTTVMRDTFPLNLATYKEKLVEEVLLCVTEGVFSVRQVCQAINILSMFYPDRKKCLQTTDKLWFGIVDQHNQLDKVDNIVAVFGALPNLNKSRPLILKVLEKAALENWELYEPSDMIEIIRVLVDLKYDTVTPAFLTMISEWLAVNIHKVKESEMLAIVYSFLQLEYVDNRFISSLEKTIKHRGCQIKEMDLISIICEYCLFFRIRSVTVLEGASEYFIHNSSKLSVPQIYSIASIFGELDFHPTSGFKFWKELEHVLEMKFVQFKPVEIIQLLVTFLCIEKYPLNFVHKVFNVHFLDRLHNQEESDVLLSRTQLKLFDAGMKLECRAYGGPYLPRDTGHRKFDYDMRVRDISELLAEPLGEMLGDSRRVGSNVVLFSLPLHPNFVADLMIYPTAKQALLRFGFKTENSSNIAVLVLLPTHYDRTGNNLIGNQVMRIRQLKAMGFRVMTVDYSQAKSFMIEDPVKLKDYLRRRYSAVVSPIK